MIAESLLFPCVDYLNEHNTMTHISNIMFLLLIRRLPSS